MAPPLAALIDRSAKSADGAVRFNASVVPGRRGEEIVLDDTRHLFQKARELG